MTVLHAVVLGLVQGVAEFLPISSSGHLVLAQQLLGWQEPNLMFDVFLHFATLLAILVYFASDIINLSRKELLIVVIGSIPAGAVGMLLLRYAGALFGSVTVVALALVVTGVLNLVTDTILKKRELSGNLNTDEAELVGEKRLTVLRGFVIGLFQAVAIIPGISRSGSTIFGGIFQGLNRKTAFTYSFLLSVPAIGSATLLQLIEVFQGDATIHLGPTLLGFGVAFVVGLGSLRLFKYVIDNSKLELFGWYCLILASLLLLIF